MSGKLTIRPDDPVYTVTFPGGRSVEAQSVWTTQGAKTGIPKRLVYGVVSAAEAAVEELESKITRGGITVHVAGPQGVAAEVRVDAVTEISYRGEVRNG